MKMDKRSVISNSHIKILITNKKYVNNILLTEKIYLCVLLVPPNNNIFVVTGSSIYSNINLLISIYKRERESRVEWREKERDRGGKKERKSSK